MTTRLVEVRRQILKHNDVVARALRSRFHEAGTFVVSLVSSPGAGKTSLLCEVLRRLGRAHRVAALVGDLATDNDARRLSASGAAVRQIVTGTVCHLEAAMIERALAGGDEAEQPWRLDELDFLFIENVGNLVCPASYDLGEDLRLVLVSTTEGEDKPLKYPTIFNTADVCVLTKVDLAAAAGFDSRAMLDAIWRVRPGMRVIETSVRNGVGVDEVIELVTAGRETVAPACHR